jgi:hypothetical protein
LRYGAGEGDLQELESLGAGEKELEFAAEREKAGKSLKGKYIVRVGWDDVRGWLGEGGTLIGSSRCPSCKLSTDPLLINRTHFQSERGREDYKLPKTSSASVSIV